MALPNKSEEFYFLGHRGIRRFILGRSSRLFHPETRIHTHEYDGIFYKDGTGLEKVILLKSLQGCAISMEVYESMEHVLLMYPGLLIQWIDEEKEKTGPITLFQ